MASGSPNPQLNPTPWPFNDGVLFFNDHMEVQSDGVLVIPHVLQNHQASDLVVKRIGVGRIGARFKDKDENGKAVRIWCEWLGNVDSTSEEAPKHDFAVVTFSYTHNLGRMPVVQDHSCCSERTCDICQQKLYPNKDVAALLNLETGKLVCSTRNRSGAFHLCHVSCLIQWMLIFEAGSFTQALWLPRNEKEAEAKDENKHVPFCSLCRGTGKILDGQGIPIDEDGKRIPADEDGIPIPIEGEGIPTVAKYLEKPYHTTTEISSYRNILRSGHDAWTESPEALDNYSLGFYFPERHDVAEIDQETVAHLHLLEFYRADD